MEQQNKGLIATQNKDRRMAYESLLKSYSATINGCEGDKPFLKMILGELDYGFLKEKGLADFCYMKMEELYRKFPFPDTPQKKLTAKDFAEAKAEAPIRQAEQDLADTLKEEKIKEEEKEKEEEIMSPKDSPGAY